MANILEGCIDIVWPLACSKRITMACSVPPLARNTAVVGDSLRVRQILVHLLNNAAKFTDSGTIEVTLRAEELPRDKMAITIEVCPPFCTVLRERSPLGRMAVARRSAGLQVTDTGVGIPEAFMPHLFSSFTQATEARTRRHGGLGLGLAICSHFAALMGASLTVENNKHAPGSTAVLSVQLPIHKGSMDSNSAASNVEEQAAPPQAGTPKHTSMQRLQRCVAIVHVQNLAIRRQLHACAECAGMSVLVVPSLEYGCAQAAMRAASSLHLSVKPVLICEAAAVPKALQEGWKRRSVVALCVEEMVPHALRMFVVSLMLPIKQRAFTSAVEAAATGRSSHESSLEVPLGKPQAEPSVATPCTAGFGGKQCGFCAKCQQAGKTLNTTVCSSSLSADSRLCILSQAQLSPSWGRGLLLHAAVYRGGAGTQAHLAGQLGA